MRFIPTRVHGVPDYLTGGVPDRHALGAGVRLDVGRNHRPMFLGLFVICYSLVTSYEWGLTGILTMRNNLWLDFGGGLFLALSPCCSGSREGVGAARRRRGVR